MRYGFAATVAAVSLMFAAVAYAADTPSHVEGSGQGGYLGSNPGANAPQQAPGPQLGSLQGGYLGKNPGAQSQPPRQHGTVDASSPPAAYCDALSMEPDRCKSRADADHKMCVQNNPDHYASCRRTLDLFGWRL